MSLIFIGNLNRFKAIVGSLTILSKVKNNYILCNQVSEQPFYQKFFGTDPHEYISLEYSH